MMLTATLLVALAAAPAEGAAGVFNPCDCKDLPRLFEELLEQQRLRDLCKEYLDGKTKPDDEFLSIGEVQDRLKWRLQQHVAGRRAGRQASGEPAAGGQGAAAPALGTDFLHDTCGLQKYVAGDEPGKLVPVPTSEEEVRTTDCSAISEYLLDHERLHQERCRARFKKDGHGRELLKPSNYLKEDHDAYKKSVERLRREIAALAADCGWKGSNRVRRRDDGTRVVPTEPQIQQLKDAVRKKAAALRKGAGR